MINVNCKWLIQLNLGHSFCVSEDPEATEEDSVDDEVAEIRVDYRRSR